MKLLKFKIENFRCLRSTPWVELRKLTIFTGQNDGGKTSSLDALSVFLDRRAKADINDFSKLDDNSSCKQMQIEGVFKLSQNEREKMDWHSDELYITNTRTNDGKSEYFYKTKVHSDPRLQRDLDSIPIAELKQIAEDYKITVDDKRSKEPIITEIRKWLSSQTLQDGFLELSASFFEYLPSILLFKSASALDPEYEVTQTLSNIFLAKLQTTEYSGQFVAIQSKIEQDMKDGLVDFRDIVKKYCTGIANIDIVPSFDFRSGFKTSKLKIEKPNGLKIELNKEGEGQKRRMTLAVYEWRKKILLEATVNVDKQLIVAFDEPDTHLDYSSQRMILDQIKLISANDKNAVIICTHSLNLIDRVPITDIVHFKKTGIETLKTEDPELIDVFLYGISDCMGLKNSVLLNERCFLIVEGETELYSLPILFQKINSFSLQGGGIRLIDAGGCGAVRTFAKFLNENKRNVLFLVDKDVQTKPHLKLLFTKEKLQSDGFDLSKQVFFVGTREFEDSFSDEAYARTVNAYWPKHDKSPWLATEFQAIRTSEDYCKELFRLLQSKAHKNLNKPIIGRSLAKTVDAAEIPAEITNCLNKALELATPV